MARGKVSPRQRLAFALLVSTALALPSGASTLQDDSKIERAIQIFNQGKLFHQQRQYQEAIRAYEESLDLDDQNPFVHNALGLALAAVGDFEDALSSFRKAISINPDLTDVYNNMGMVYAEQGQRERAFEAFSRAVRDPHYPTPEKALYNLGNLYLDERNLELALVHFRRSIEREPEFALGYRGLGKVHLALGEVDFAIEQFEKAVELDENDSESLYQLARIHEERDELERALELYRRVVEVDRFSPYGQLAMQNLETLKGGS